MPNSWARLVSFCHLGVISDTLIVLKFHNETHDPKGQENKIYTIVKDRETFYRRHTVPVTSCSKVKYILKRVSFGSKDCTKELKVECAYVWFYQSPLILTELIQHNLINVSYLTACYLYQVMMTMYFLNDVANDGEPTQKSKITS